MATTSQVLSETPVDLVAELSLSDGESYSAQFVGKGQARVMAAAAAPTDPRTAMAKVYADGESWVIEATTEPDWAWVLGGSGGYISVDPIGG